MIRRLRLALGTTQAPTRSSPLLLMTASSERVACASVTVTTARWAISINVSPTLWINGRVFQHHVVRAPRHLADQLAKSGSVQELDRLTEVGPASGQDRQVGFGLDQQVSQDHAENHFPVRRSVRP